MIHEAGNIYYEDRSGFKEYYLLSNYDIKKLTLISLSNGNRFYDSDTTVQDIKNITDEEFKLISGYSIFKIEFNFVGKISDYKFYNKTKIIYKRNRFNLRTI